jgi:lipooligosaccharide transport system permease protein
MIDILTPPRLGRRAIRVWQRNRDVWYKLYKASLVGNLGEPILFLLAFGYGLSKFVGSVDGVPYIQFIAPGLVVSAAMNASAFECTFGSFIRMTEQKTYDAIMVTPVNIEEVAAGDLLWGMTKGFISSSIILPVFVIAGLMHSPWLLLAPVLALLVGLMFSSMSLVVTAFAPTFEFFTYYFTLVISPMFFFSGIFFPLSAMPAWVGKAAWFFPLSHAVNVTRGLASGNLSTSLIGDVAWMLVFTLIMTWLGIKLIKRRLVK